MAELENGYPPLSTAEERRRSILSGTAGRNTGCTNISSPADTPITISPTETRPIRDIRVGDTVLAFDPAAGLGRGALVPRRVVRIHRNATREWVRPGRTESSAAKKVVLASYECCPPGAENSCREKEMSNLAALNVDPERLAQQGTRIG